jgi:hypothetical protein
MSLKGESKMKCECADNMCPNHPGEDCKVLASSEGKFITLYRVDMLDKTGTVFCPRCAEDALESMLYTPIPNPGIDMLSYRYNPGFCAKCGGGIGNCTCED